MGRCWVLPDKRQALGQSHRVRDEAEEETGDPDHPPCLRFGSGQQPLVLPGLDLSSPTIPPLGGLERFDRLPRSLPRDEQRFGG